MNELKLIATRMCVFEYPGQGTHDPHGALLLIYMQPHFVMGCLLVLCGALGSCCARVPAAVLGSASSSKHHGTAAACTQETSHPLLTIAALLHFQVVLFLQICCPTFKLLSQLSLTLIIFRLKSKGIIFL